MRIAGTEFLSAVASSHPGTTDVMSVGGLLGLSVEEALTELYAPSALTPEFAAALLLRHYPGASAAEAFEMMGLLTPEQIRELSS